MRIISVLGGVACVLSLFFLPVERLDRRFFMLAALTLVVGARCSIRIPRVSAHISVSDTFTFLTILLFGGEAAVVVAALDGLFTSMRFSRNPRTICFNAAVVALSTFAAAEMLHWAVGDISLLSGGAYTATLVASLFVLTLCQYALNSGLVALAGALKAGQPFVRHWRQNYLWTSVTYFAGASAAGIIVKLIEFVGFYAFAGSLPVIAIVYFTYYTYLKNVETSARQVEQAERHVEELSHYIAEQERIRAQLSQLEKLSALGELASGVAHDFNNTLTGILGRAQLLTRTGDPEKIKKGLQIIIKTAEDGAKTVKRIQDFARQRRDHDFAPVRVDQLLLDVEDMTRPRWKDAAEAGGIHIRVVLRLDSRACVMGDESELREVLVNMVFNAVDAMPRGGTLTLSTGESGDEVQISVADTGTGISEAVRSRVFDPFFTTKGRAGMGLGLAVSFGIIHRHAGAVEVESEIGRGSCFKINLPLAKGVVKEVAEAETPAARPAPGGEARARILVVDDEQHVRGLLSDILHAEGYEAVTAGGGAEALALMRGGRFDAVFTDIGMPGMSGWELARAVRELDAELPLAVITGWGEAVGSVEQEEARVNWIVAKPFTFGRILEIAQEVSSRKELAARRGDLVVAAT
jgi:signal transduction histidine kinase/ActR/RegA family two-component response regulator